MPLTTTRRQYAALIQFCGNPAQAGDAVLCLCVDHRAEILRVLVGSLTNRVQARVVSLLSLPQCPRTVRVAQLHAAPLGRCKCLTGATRDRLTLLLCYERHDADGQLIRVWHVR